MNIRPIRIAAVFTIAAAMQLCPFATNATSQTIAEKPKPAIELGAPFADNAVLQRQMPVPVWGWSKPGTNVSVEFAGQKQKATADKDGKWMIELQPLDASFEPREMVITDNHGNRVAIKNILVGEVWLASGQSNMQWQVQKSSCNQLRVEVMGDVAPIREFEVTSVVAMLHPIERAEGAWKNGGYSDYSAIAFAFAHKLYAQLNVPIGILNCSFSQTAIQAWIPRVGFRDSEDEYTKAIYKKILETDPTTPEHKVAWGTFYQDIEQTLKANTQRVNNGETPQAISTKTPGNMSGNRDASWLFNGRLNPVIPYAIRGGIWNQGYANMGEGLPYYNNLHSLIRGWRMRWNNPELPVYFHQFYSAGQNGENNAPSIDSTAEMRLGTWLARDIPNAGMASQIDITGSIHYFNKAVPGQRLALHALKNQYEKDIVADGPMFKSYKVEGNKLIVEFEHAEGGLVVAETRSNTDRSNKDATGFADPKVVAGGDDQVKLFYLADENRVWYPAVMKIDGSKVIVTTPKVKNPRGVSYATGGVGFQPNLYNRALLPMTPFIYYDDKLVTSETWPDDELTIADVVVDPDTVGKKYDWRKMPLLSTQFRDNAVLQAGVPITIWGSAVHDYGHEAEGEAVIKFSFAGIEKTIPVTDDSPSIVELDPGQSRYAGGAKEWRVTVPPMEASAEPKTLKVTFTIDGEVAHERVCTNIVVGDVWYVAAPQMELDLSAVKPSGGLVRVMARKAKRSSHPFPSRYSVCVSRTPLNRFACTWDDAESDLAGVLGHRIATKTGNPVGIIFMQTVAPKGGSNPELKSWIAANDLKQAPSLMEDYKDLAAVVPGNPYYNANVNRYLTAWKQYWGEYVPQMMATKAVPDGAAWGSYPTLASSVTTEAAQTYNVLVHSFTPGSVKGIIFLASPEMFTEDQGANYGEQLSALANSWKDRFGGVDPNFIYTIPNKKLVPKVTQPKKIKGKTVAIEIGNWSEIAKVIEAAVESWP